MTRPMRHMTLNVAVLSVVYLGLRLVQPEAPEPTYEECDVSVEAANYSQACDKVPPDGFNDLIETAAREYGVDPTILATTVYRESDCDPRALGKSGEIGLGQILPRVWLADLQETGIVNAASDLYDPLTNLRATAYVLKTLSERADNARELFRLYNGSGHQARQYASEQMATYRELWGKTARL